MKFGKQLKLQAVPEWQEYYMSYKRLKRIIKKLCVQQKEREERQMKELADGGHLTHEQMEQLKAEQAEQQRGKGAKSPIQSYSPMLSSSARGTPEGQRAGAKVVRNRLSGMSPNIGGAGGAGASGVSPHNLLSSSPSNRSDKGSPGLLLGGDAYAEFFHVVESDIDKVNRFFAAKYEEILEQFKQIEAATAKNAGMGGRSASGLSGLTNRSFRGKSGIGGGDVDDEENAIISPSGVQARNAASSNAAAAAPGRFTSSVAAVAAWMTSSKKRAEKAAAAERAAAAAAAEKDYGALEAAEAKDSDRLLRGGDSSVADSGASGNEGGGDGAGSRRGSEAPAHTISTSQQKQLEEKLQALLDLYRPALQLQIYSLINYEGLRKIVKKLDKNIGEDHEQEFGAKLEAQPFRDTEALNTLVARIEDLYTKLNLRRPNQDLWSSQGTLRAIKREVDNPIEKDPTQHQMSILYVLLAMAAGCAVLLLPILSHEPRAKSCAALLSFITVLWVSEAVPFFVAALCIPFLVVLLGILADPSGVPLTADRATKAAMGFMFNDTIMLILGGFSISAAFSKCNFELRLASLIQRAFGHRPRLFLLAFMMLGCFLSCWISNIAAPVLLTSLLLPIVRDFGSTSDYARAILLGLAFACNIGGMMSPISSPQNAIALGYLQATLPGESISFTRWLSVSFPFCLLLVVACWLYLILVFCAHDDDMVGEIPMIVFEKTPVNRTQVTVVLVTLTTIVLWCTLSETEALFGEMGTIAVIPMVAFFGTGILNKTDLQGFQWNLILLIAGGNVLGAAVNSSQLLHIISQSLEPYLAGHSPYVTTLTVLLAVALVSKQQHTHTTHAQPPSLLFSRPRPRPPVYLMTTPIFSEEPSEWDLLLPVRKTTGRSHPLT
jgi:anion transporter